MRRIIGLILAAPIMDGQERFQLYTTHDGLPNNSVLTLLQAKYGYLRFTTYGGMVHLRAFIFRYSIEAIPLLYTAPPSPRSA
jgi:hypothetical protein